MVHTHVDLIESSCITTLWRERRIGASTYSGAHFPDVVVTKRYLVPSPLRSVFIPELASVVISSCLLSPALPRASGFAGGGGRGGLVPTTPDEIDGCMI